MIRRLVPLAALAGLLAACSSGAANTPEPGAPSTSRGEAEGGDRRPGGRGQERGERRVMGGRDEMLLRGITLSAEQQQRIQAIRANHRTQVQKLREEARADNETPRDRVQALMEKQQGEVRAVLTTEQQAQFDRNVTEMRERMQRGGRRPGRDARA